MKNRHAIIDPKTGLVRNVVVWEGAEWLPPRDHYVVHDCEGLIGDYWDQDRKCFYTMNGKHRYITEKGKAAERDMSEEEKKELQPRLKQVYEHARRELRWDHIPDLTQWDNPVPDSSVPVE